MEPAPQLIDQLYIEKVLRARMIPPERKFLAGARLFEYARRIAMSAIKAENPNATPEEQRKMFRRRLQIARILDNHP